MCSVIRYEYFLSIIHDYAIWKFKVLRTTKFVQNIPHLIKYYDTHNFTFHDDNSPFVVNADATWMLRIKEFKLYYK